MPGDVASLDPVRYGLATTCLSLTMLTFIIILSISLLRAAMVAATPSLTQMISFLKQYNQDWSYPRVVEIAKTINYTALDPNVVGRVDITNTFNGVELNTEYLFGMFASFGQSTNISLIGVPLNFTISELVVQGNTLSTALIVNFNWTVEIVPVQFNVFFMFNDEGKVIQYDSQLVRSEWLFTTVSSKLVPLVAAQLGMNPTTTDPTTVLSTRAAYDICAAHEEYCLGPNQQYNSTAECMNFIQNIVAFGDIWSAGQDTGICRYLHKAMVSYRPAVHCPHIGPSGGDMCISRDYNTVVTENPFSQPFIQLPGNLTLNDLNVQGCN